MDQPGIGAYIYSIDSVTGVRDSALAKNRSSSNSHDHVRLADSDLRLGFQELVPRQSTAEQLSAAVPDLRREDGRDHGHTRLRGDVSHATSTGRRTSRCRRSASNRFNLTPSFSLAERRSGPFWVASERTNGKYVHQSKRITSGLSASPTLFGFFPGLRPVPAHSPPDQAAHSATRGRPPATSATSISRASDDAKGLPRQPGRTVTFGLTQNFEAKVGTQRHDANREPDRRFDLLSINFDAALVRLRARAESRRRTATLKLAGFTTETWGYTLQLRAAAGLRLLEQLLALPGQHAERHGEVQAVSHEHLGVVELQPRSESVRGSRAALRQSGARSRKAGTAERSSCVPSGRRTGAAHSPRSRSRAARAAATASSFRRRRVARVLHVQPSSPRPAGRRQQRHRLRSAARCEQIRRATNPFLLDACLAQAARSADDRHAGDVADGRRTVYHIPPTTSLNCDISFNLTPKWAAHWQTTYDFERHEFASHIVQLQRELHDWRAIFGFTQSPNGNFAFNFTIALKAEPDLKFDYNRKTVARASVLGLGHLAVATDQLSAPIHRELLYG